MKLEPNRAPLHFVAPGGGRCVRVPLARHDASAIVDADDYNRLIAQGVSPHWCVNLDGSKTRRYVRVTIAGDNVRTVARLITGAGRGERVHYRDGNPLNLRGDNLRVTKGGHATVDCAELLAPQHDPMAAAA